MEKLSFGDDTTVLKAYHGTSLKNAESIIKNGFRPSVGVRHWLGDGVYFFREDKEQARTWAYHEKRKLRAQGKHWKANKYRGCVFEWKTILSEEEFLNLDTRSGAICYSEHLEEFMEMIDEEGIQIPGNWWYLNSLCYEGIDEKFKVIQRTFSVPSAYDKHDTTIFNTLMFLPIKTGKDNEEIEVPNIPTHLINGCQVVVRDPKLITQDALKWLAC